MDKEKEIEVLKAQVETLKKEKAKLKRQKTNLEKQIARDKEMESVKRAWEFHYHGQGDYEQAYRGFYGDFG